MRTTKAFILAATIGLVAVAAGGVLAQAGRYPASRHGGNYMHNFYFPPSPSSTPWAPSWAPDGESIAVAMSGSIWRVDPDTGVADELTYSPDAYHSSPDWSPDGRWIVYTADYDGTRVQLELLEVETGETRALTDDAHVYSDPTFSPSGDRISYVSTRPNGYFNVSVRPVDEGRWAGDEMPLTTDNTFGSNRLYFGPWDMHLTPTWLPEGDELLLVSNRAVPLGSGNAVRVPAVEGGIRDATTVLREQTLYRTRPDVASDGKRFVYSSTRGAADQFNNLYVQPTVGGEPYKLTFFQHDAFHPRWSPDDEWIAFIMNEGGLPQLALLETHGGEIRRVAITDRRWKRPMGELSLSTRDSGTGEATGSRVHLAASDGKFYAPADAYARLSGQGDHLFHTAGRFTVELPVGPVELTVVKGFEFWPETTTATITAGEVTEVTVDIRRMTDMAADGWYSASTHVHSNYGGNLHNTLENLMMMSEAEDQDLVLEQVANKDNRILDYQYFEPGGGPHTTSTPERLVVVGQEYRPPFYGHVFMFGMRDHLLSPFTMGYEGTAIESLYPSNTDMFRKAKAQGATVGYVHAFGGERDPLDGNLGGGKGFMVDAALGTTDAVEWSDASRAGFYPLYAVWNNGLRITATGGEDSISNLHRSKLVGSMRTYVHTGTRGLDMDAWFEGLRAGRAFVSSGPLVDLTIDGQMPGEEVNLPSDGGTVEIVGRVRSVTPLDRLFLVCDGETVTNVPLGGDGRTARLRVRYRITRSGWCHLRAEGATGDRYPMDVAYVQAFTNPVWIQVGGQPIRNRAAADYALQWIDKLQEMADAWPGWRAEKERAHVFAQFDEARDVYRRFARESVD
ncbi:MAG: CehA/McbA family metallohydrolase [Vicinamibacterales bacterium]|nr:CehA/McbA family metallohydrolase [Vicinamibacterales bacterium]